MSVCVCVCVCVLVCVCVCVCVCGCVCVCMGVDSILYIFQSRDFSYCLKHCPVVLLNMLYFLPYALQSPSVLYCLFIVWSQHHCISKTERCQLHKPLQAGAVQPGPGGLPLQAPTLRPSTGVSRSAGDRGGISGHRQLFKDYSRKSDS